MKGSWPGSCLGNATINLKWLLLNQQVELSQIRMRIWPQCVKRYRCTFGTLVAKKHKQQKDVRTVKECWWASKGAEFCMSWVQWKMLLLSEYKCSVASLREGKKKTRQCQTGLSCLCSLSTSDFSFKDSCYLWTGINFRTPVLAWDTFYNLPQVQLRSLAVLQALHINSKLRQQQRQTHYTGKKEKVLKKASQAFISA